MSGADKRFLVVIPTYNERENLPRIVPQVLEVDPSIHVLVVDDNSPDGTGQVADALAVAHPERLHVLHREGKEGLGRAYIAGFRWALERDYEWVCEMDADLGLPESHLAGMRRRVRGQSRGHAARHGSGFRLQPGKTRRHGTVRLSAPDTPGRRDRLDVISPP